MLKKSFISGALILMFSGLIVRLMGFIYRIYLSNLIGAEGMGLFQLIFPLYGLVILTLTSGISISVSRMVAEEVGINNPANKRKIMICGMQLVVGVSIIASLLCFAYADFISISILKDWRTYFSLILLIPCIPVIAAASALKGYFYGMQEMIPTAVSQIVEQIVRIGLVMLTASWFLNLGLEYACAIATFGTALGEIANLLVLLLIYLLKKRKQSKDMKNESLPGNLKIYKELIFSAFPISFNRFIISIMGVVETLLIPARLVFGGMSHKLSLEAFGRMTGMAMPLIFFPTVITSALATALVPSISESAARNNYKGVRNKISRTIQMTIVQGIIFTIIFSCYSNQICDVIYRNGKVGASLYLLSFTCVFIYLQQILGGVLNGLGMQTTLLWNSLIGGVLRIGFVYFYIPLYGIESYVWCIMISAGMVCILNMYAITTKIDLIVDIKNWFVKPGIVGVLMAVSSRYIYSFFSIFLSKDIWIISFTLLANFIIAMELMLLVGVIEKNELAKLLGFKK
ncbi:MAG: stage V sporulation protein B [Ignavibacteriales bacterium]